VRDPRHPPRDLGNLVASLFMALLLAGGLATTAAGFVGKKRRPAWVAATAGPVTLFFVTSCEMLGANRRSAQTVWQRVATVYFHRGIGAGPVLTTNTDGSLGEERRYEPFGQPIDAEVGGTLGPVDFRREQQNSLGKLTDPNTGWSYHGARWVQPQTARWTTPDAAVKGPSLAQVVEPWMLNPYQYASQNPLQFFDPAGEAPEFTEEQINSLAEHEKAAAESGRRCLGTFNAGMKGLFGDENFKTSMSDDTVEKVIDRLGGRARPMPEASSVKYSVDRSSSDKVASYAANSARPSDILTNAMADKERFGVFALGPDRGYHSMVIVGEKKDGKLQFYWFDEDTRRSVTPAEIDKKLLAKTQMGLDDTQKLKSERGLSLDMWEIVPDTGSPNGPGDDVPTPGNVGGENNVGGDTSTPSEEFHLDPGDVENLQL